MNWKIFSENIPALVSRGEIGGEFALIPILFVLYIVTAFLILKGYTKARRLIQAIAFLVFTIIFFQCLCNTKQLVWGTQDLVAGDVAQAIAMFWFPVFTIVAVLFLGRKFYCFWICPLGFLQDITGNVNLIKRNKRLGFTILCILLIGVGLIMSIIHLFPVIKEAGAWLGVLALIISMLVVTYPHKERQFGKFKYLVLVGWAVLATTHYKVPGPWCLLAQSNLAYSAIISFFCVLLASVVIPRAWCRYICPDGGLLQLISRSKKAVL